MKCEEVRQMISEYRANTLAKPMRQRLLQHVEDCPSCRVKHGDIGRSQQPEKADGPVHVPRKSIVDSVMLRILSEEKWAIPIGRRVFTVTARMRRVGALIAILLLVVCSVVLYSNSDEEKLLAGTIVPPTKTEVIAASIEITAEQLDPFPDPLSADSNQVALASGTIGYAFQPEESEEKPNYGMMLGFFGILITVLGMSWLTRA